MSLLLIPFCKWRDWAFAEKASSWRRPPSGWESVHRYHPTLFFEPCCDSSQATVSLLLCTWRKEDVWACLENSPWVCFPEWELRHQVRGTLPLKRRKAGGEGDDRGWEGAMASLTQWTWVWASPRGRWWTGKPGVLQSAGSQRVGHDRGTELQQVHPLGRIAACKQTSVTRPKAVFLTAAVSAKRRFREAQGLRAAAAWPPGISEAAPRPRAGELGGSGKGNRLNPPGKPTACRTGPGLVFVLGGKMWETTCRQSRL